MPSGVYERHQERYKPRVISDPVLRFWSQVDRSGGPDACWPWTGTRVRRGYGQFNVRRARIPAHRYAYDLAHPDAPLGALLACHHCDNPPCCNAAHLFAGDSSANQLDAAEKRRHRNARKTHCAMGHEYTSLNVASQRVARYCRVCHTASERRRRAGKADT